MIKAKRMKKKLRRALCFLLGHNMRKTIKQKYGPAMTIIDQTTADAYFEACVQDSMSDGKTRVEAERSERENLGYYAGYYSNETRERIERLFQCAHPIFGKIAERGAPTAQEAFAAGMQ